MGGPGSGRWQSEATRPVAEWSLAFPIRLLRNGIADVLMHGPGAQHHASIRWFVADYQRAGAGYNVVHRYDGTLHLIFSYSCSGEQEVDFVPLVSTPCHFGGMRWWFRCPSCKRRVGVLYNPQRYWRCRHCYGITYDSSNDSHRYDRLFESMGFDSSVQKLLRQRWKS